MTVVVAGNVPFRLVAWLNCGPPARCRKINGTGRFLIPGIIGTHVHVFGYSKVGENNPATEDSILQMLVSNGVATALVMAGTPEILQIRSQIQRRERFSPSLFFAGKMIQAPMTGAPPGRETFATPEEVQDEIEAEKREGYDFVKVHGPCPRKPTPLFFRLPGELICGSSIILARTNLRAVH